MRNGFVPLWILVLLALALFFAPLPFKYEYVPCAQPLVYPGTFKECPKQFTLGWSPSIAQILYKQSLKLRLKQSLTMYKRIQIQFMEPPETGEVASYIAFSQAAQYVVYGRVIEALGQTKENITPAGTSLVIPVYFNHFLIEVIDSGIALGGASDQLSLSNRIVIREASTSHSPDFTRGEVFFAFLVATPNKGTYSVAGYDNNLGKFKIITRNGQPYVESGQSAYQLLHSLSKSPREETP